MNEIPASTQLLCQQCAAALVVEMGSAYATCEYCNTVNFLDKSEAVLHYAVRPTLDENQATAALRRWMAGNQTIKGLDTAAQIEPPLYQLFPLWRVVWKKPGDEKIYLRPAAALASAEFVRLTIAASEMEPYSHELDEIAVKASVPLTALDNWLSTGKLDGTGWEREVSLVHVPIYQFRYGYNGKQYSAIVDGAAGRVLALIFPAKYEAPYLRIATLGCGAYFLAALIPAIFALILDDVGLLIGIGAYLAVAAALAIPIFAAAARVSARH